MALPSAGRVEIGGALLGAGAARFNCGRLESSGADAGVLCACVASPELDAARRSLGLSSSLPFDELPPDEPDPDNEPDPDEAALSSPALDAARRSVGGCLLPDSPPEEPVPESPDVEPDEVLAVMGREVSPVAADAAECSSAVPSHTIVIEVA